MSSVVNKRLKLLEVVHQGLAGYLTEGANVFSEYPITSDVLKAKDYSDDPRALQHDMACLYVDGDSSFAKSGLRVSSPPKIVELELMLTITVLSKTVGREVFK